ncbi:MAG: FAD-dependent oxidoreductase [Lachnoclostridium edouardi]|uniref:FAD-dependent oxidoreductase n=1 Tax=Lachnoclostridium edouardi TaxID=1926283 RepID=UPI0026DBC951|nr:FAD-dependent oxidoreductase [Lachnoclostridium edouardi]MDO4279318.1 FAD-dependent oxidoreductase [Lachnoclostridium edouardi]
MKVVIVGGVAGGASAAARIRRLDENAQIIVFERTSFISYANCGLPYYVGGVIQNEEDLTLQTPEGFWDRFRVDVRVRHEVTEIHTEKKTVTVCRLETGKVYEESYDKLILSPGAKPTQPNMPGIDNDKIFTLRTVEDTLKIHKFIESEKPKSATVIGGGFIGIEMAENLAELGIKVTLAEYANHLLAPFDFDMACIVHSQLESHGIRLMLNTAVTGFEKNGDSIITKTAGEHNITSDMVLLAIGVTPETELAEKAGLELGIKGSIAVNDKMETSAPDVYAVGDAVEIKHFVTGKKGLISLAGPANKQGRIAADNICGGNSVFSGAQGSSVIKLFDMTAASTGINEFTAKAAGIDWEAVILSPASHAGYYPGSKVMTMKVVYDKASLRLLGAQIVGFDGVDKRIDVLATAIRAGMKATELTELDLAYAPPYSSAKDPVNMAGFMIENIVSGKVKQFHYDQAEELSRDGSVTLLDTRTPVEYGRGHVDGFVNIPVDDLRERLNEIPKDKPVYVMCQSGLRSYLACRILSQNGYDCYNFSGGYGFYHIVKSGEKPSETTYPCGMNKS